MTSVGGSVSAAADGAELPDDRSGLALTEAAAGGHREAQVADAPAAETGVPLTTPKLPVLVTRRRGRRLRGDGAGERCCSPTRTAGRSTTTGSG